MFGRRGLAGVSVVMMAMALAAGCHHGSGGDTVALTTNRRATSTSTSTTSTVPSTSVAPAVSSTTSTSAASTSTTKAKAKPQPGGTVTTTTRAPVTTRGTTATTQPATTTTTTEATGPCNSGGGGADANQIANLFCSYRSRNGLPTMTRSSSLDQMAQQWAAQMASDGALSHNPDLSGSVLARCSRCNGWAENVAFDTSAAKAWNEWLGSSDHLANIEDGHAGEYGIGVVSSGGYLWFVQDFGRYPQ